MTNVVFDFMWPRIWKCCHNVVESVAFVKAHLIILLL